MNLTLKNLVGLEFEVKQVFNEPSINLWDSKGSRVGVIGVGDVATIHSCDRGDYTFDLKIGENYSEWIEEEEVLHLMGIEDLENPIGLKFRLKNVDKVELTYDNDFKKYLGCSRGTLIGEGEYAIVEESIVASFKYELGFDDGYKSEYLKDKDLEQILELACKKEEPKFAIREVCEMSLYNPRSGELMLETSIPTSQIDSMMASNPLLAPKRIHIDPHLLEQLHKDPNKIELNCDDNNYWKNVVDEYKTIKTIDVLNELNDWDGTSDCAYYKRVKTNKLHTFAISTSGNKMLKDIENGLMYINFPLEEGWVRISEEEYESVLDEIDVCEGKIIALKNMIGLKK